MTVEEPMPRRSYWEIFIDELTKLSEGGQNLVGNGRLRDCLGWDQDRYSRVKAQLVDEGRIIVGRGKGGSVGLADAPDSGGLSVFISYSRSDDELKSELLKHLDPLYRMGWVEVWHDREIDPGTEWDREISEHLEAADLILLLVSVDFINSTYCYDIEMETAMERHDNEDARVIPVILRSCLWEHTPFAKLQALPQDAKAVAAWSDRDEALANVAAGIRRVVESIRAAAE